jgi:hypothetical protein
LIPAAAGFIAGEALAAVIVPILAGARHHRAVMCRALSAAVSE